MTFLKRYWKSLLVAAVILYLSLWKQSSQKMPDIRNADKWAHLLMYAGLAFVMHWEMYMARIGGRKLYLWGLVVPFLFGGVIEILQEQFFPPRTGSWADWLADGLGVVAGFVAFSCALHLWELFENQRRNRTPHA